MRIDHTTKQITMKVVCYGPAGSGKTACLRSIYERTRTPQAPPTWSDASAPTGPHYDLLPISLGEIRGFRTNLQLFSVPSGPGTDAARRQILEHTDGIVFVADSRQGRAEANSASLHELQQNLATHGFDLAALAYVVLLNHSDAPSVAPLEQVARPLVSWLAQSNAVPIHQGVAVSGHGVFEALKAVSKLCMLSLTRSAAPAS